MATPQRTSSSVASSLEDYDNFFDSHTSFEEKQTASCSSLPLGEDGYEAPRPYDKEATELDFDAHHSAAFYPHQHQTLKNTGGRRKHKKKEVKYKKNKVSKPSQLFQPSLQEVAEQESEHPFSPEADDEGDAASKRNDAIPEPAVPQPATAVAAAKSDIPLPLAAPISQPAPTAVDRSTVRFTLGDQDSLDGAALVVSHDDATSHALQSNSSAPSTLASASSTAGKPVRFVLGGDVSQVTLAENVFTTAPHTSAAVNTAGDQQVTFTLGAESSENFHVLGEGEPLPVGDARRARSKSIDDGQATEQPKIGPPLKNRSYSYHQGEGLKVSRCCGSDVELSDLPAKMMTRITSPDEAALLNKHDLEDLATHRFEKLRGYGKHKINKRSMAKLTTAATDTHLSKSVCDLTPHELFVELDELVTRQHDETTDLMEWKEKARWIKFEEDVLETSDRWGRPHVASLSFHSLIELRRLITNGAVLVDVQVHDYVGMMQAVVDQLVRRGLLPAEQREYVLQALILRHSHLDGKAKFTRSKSYGNLMGLESMHRHSRYSHFFGASRNNSNVPAKKAKKESDGADHVLNMPIEEGEHPLIRRNSRSYGHNLDKEKYNMELLKKIPQDAEVASVLVGTLKDLEKPCTALFRLSHGVMLEHVAEVPLPVRFLFVCVGPNIEGVEYHEIGRSLATLMSNQSFRVAAYAARRKESILIAMNAFLDESIVLPPGDFDRRTLLPIMHMAKKSLKARKEKRQAAEDAATKDTVVPVDDPLERTGKPFGGLVRDVKRKAPHYISDFKDGLNFQVFSTFIFIYFACLSPAITFGGLLGEKTDNYMGASEMLMATAVSGVVFSLIGGQPLLIPGFTGPNMVFEEGVYKISKSLDIDLLPWRLWMGVWVFVLAIVMVATEASFLVKFVTRFTHEIFSFLISLIFLWEVLYKLIKVFNTYPLCLTAAECVLEDMHANSYSTSPHYMYNNISTTTTVQSVIATVPPHCCRGSSPNNTDIYDETHSNTALLTFMLTLFTFVLAYTLKGLRNRTVLGRKITKTLGDFGVPLAIVLMCILDYIIGDRVSTEKLQVPARFSVTDPSKRSWLIPPLGTKENPFPVAHIFSAILPALLASILIFMETLIAGMIVDKKENKLRKGSAFHLDVLVMGFVAMLNGIIGVPFVCAATVRSVAHTSALTVMSRNHAPGERAKLERVTEQRVSNLLVHLLVAASLFLGVVLKYIPTAVLFGVFLYMGVASLGDIQLSERMVLLITPTKYHPVDVGYVRHVRASKMHLFTIIQVICVAILWAVKLSPAALSFPFVLILLVPLCRYVLPLAFSPQELGELDSEDDGRVLSAIENEELDYYMSD